MLGPVVVTALALGPAAAPEGPACATVDHLAASRAGHGPAAAAAVQGRPWDEVQLVVDSDEVPVRVHYDDALFEEDAAEVLAYAEAAWQRQVTDQGWPAPLPDGGRGGDDRLDIYLVGLAGVGGLTLVDDDEYPDDGRHAAPAHLRVNPAAPDLENVVHHELNHALQFAVDASASLMLFEATAVLQEVLALAGEDDNAWAGDLEDYQRYPQAPPFTDGVRWGEILGEPTYYEYGAVLLLLYVDEVYGEGDGVLIRRLWEASVQPDEVEENEPDWMDALPDETGVSLPEMIPHFALWRALVGPKAVDGAGPSVGGLLTGSSALWTRTLLVDQMRGQPLPGTTETFGSPRDLGCIHLEVRADQGQDEELEIAVESLADPPSPLSLSWVRIDTAADEATFALGPVGEGFTERVAVPAGPTFLAAVCDASDPDADAVPAMYPVEIRVWNTRLPKAGADEDAGPDPEPEPAVDGGPEVPPMPCSCQQAGGGAGQKGPFDEAKELLWPALFAAGAISIFIRFRRARRNRNSIKGSGYREQMERARQAASSGPGSEER